MSCCIRPGECAVSRMSFINSNPSVPGSIISNTAGGLCEGSMRGRGFVVTSESNGARLRYGVGWGVSLLML